MYPKTDFTEKQRVEQVFDLTGGELADKPLRLAYARSSGDTSGLPYRRTWARYFYDGVPNYAEADFARRTGTFITIVVDEQFQELPRTIYARGRRWKRIAAFRSSGETDCPDTGHVIAEAVFPLDRCPLCEARIGEHHESIYIGDGWSEVVYGARE